MRAFGALLTPSALALIIAASPLLSASGDHGAGIPGFAGTTLARAVEPV